MTVFVPTDPSPPGGGPYLGVNGTAGAPTYAFLAATDMGMFNAATGVLGFAALGVEVARFSATLAQIPAASVITWNGRSALRSATDGYITLTDNAGTSFTGLRFGGVSASYPMLKRATTTLSARLADDSGDAAFLAGSGTFSGVLTGTAGTGAAPGLALGAAGDGVFRVSAGIMALTGTGVEVARFSATVAQVPAAAGIFWNGRTQLTAPTNGQLMINNNGASGSVSQLIFDSLSSNGSKIRNNGGGIMNFEDGAVTGVAAQCRAAQWFNPAGTWGMFFNTSSTFGSSGNTATTVMGFGTASLTAMSIGATQNVAFHGTGGVSGNSGASTNIKSVTAQTTLSGATTNLVQIPAGAILLAVCARVTTAITSGDGATTWTFGDGTTADLFGTSLAFTLSTTVTNTAYKSTFAHKVYTSATNTVATATGGTFSGGVVRTVAYYLDVTAPTS